MQFIHSVTCSPSAFFRNMEVLVQESNHTKFLLGDITKAGASGVYVRRKEDAYIISYTRPLGKHNNISQYTATTSCK
jgi:hypothetical protein